ncbi:peroxisomal acyl-coenzyme A oxidase 3 [Capsaspora owczarzaki ATCC 30864]|uniref:Acyl-coenzyme A oxidase n=1 Tax=Capsaspora owczarzaki (strain ATCC 30864) TaxID=595528 RepID=A0A0D2UCP3_CAPO3|nr:peroxisomal acyl-coenzyme A oxidase 3 [Capsaspora owczarzaki ATCC 30864]KJE92816.1 peroxisomal acyl-coenzyme A oxidase 3 [Capsaspora owczarzaki ATCC 30864]|eukprot:XP_004363443.2 peroxisomal acyl-coenzyme A oxidase 3 [Capsaspora owczarzaki ATCC 30864]
MERVSAIIRHLTFEAQSAASSAQSGAAAGGPLASYRAKSSFQPETMRRYLDGRFYEFKKAMYATLLQDPLFRLPIAELELSRKDARHQAIRLMRRVIEYQFVTEADLEQDPMIALIVSNLLTSFDVSLAPKLFLSCGMFAQCLVNMGTERHLKYLPMIATLEIVGCFALTELAHGSNVRAMMTTATYDRTTREFVLHSPSYLATKWWVGLLGQTANYAVVFARLIIGDKDHGLHPFLVPIRTMSDHMPFPGVTVGDLGSKLGQNSLDNGFVAFNQYRIPRESLLNRLADVTPEGEYVSQFSNADRLFGATLAPLSGGRVSIVGLALTNLRSALAISVRYSAARKQFSPSDNVEELPVIEYQLQQYRLMPYVAACYALDRFYVWLSGHHFSQLQSARSGPVDPALVAEMHALSSAGKAVAGWITRDAIQTSRECCGGHGYSTCNRLGVLRDDNDPNLTYEGDNNVLIQQTSKFLMTSLRNVMTGKPVKSPLGSVAFLEQFSTLIGSKWAVESEGDLLKPAVLLHAMHYRTAYLLQEAGTKLQSIMESGKDVDTFSAWNQTQVHYLHAAAKAYLEAVIVAQFDAAIQSCPTVSLRGVLSKLLALFALWRLEGDIAVLREDDFITGQQAKLLKETVLALCLQVKDEAVSLVDAVAPPDQILFSPIGRSDGEVYKNLYNTVTTTPGCFERAPWWAEMHPPVEKGSKRAVFDSYLKAASSSH